MELEYGQWATYKGTRYMIVDWTHNTVTLYRPQSENFAVLKEYLTDISDFLHN